VSKKNGRHRKIAVCLAAGDETKTFFAYDLARLMAHSAVHLSSDAIGILVARGSRIPAQRELLAQAVLDQDYSHALFLDTDMRFPKETLVRLLDHNVAIVGAGYTERHVPYRPAVVKDLTSDERLYTIREHTGTEPVAGIGFGVVLIRRDAFEAVPRPRFTWAWSPEQDDHIGEDMFFCHKAGKAGVGIYVDHDLTKDVKHIGEVELTYDHALRAKQMQDEPKLVVVP